MNVAVPDAIVRDYDHLIEQLDLPDPSDRQQQAAALRNPPMTTTELLDGLAIVGLHESVAALRPTP